MNAFIWVSIGFILGFGSILALGAYVYFRDFHTKKFISTEGINSDMRNGLEAASPLTPTLSSADGQRSKRFDAADRITESDENTMSKDKR